MFAILLIPLWLMSSRQRKAQREAQDLLKQLQVGDEVRTHSGFFGIVTELEEDVVILETESGAETKWMRAAIAQKVEPTDAGDATAADATAAGADQDDVEIDATFDADGSSELPDYSNEVPGVTTRAEDQDSSR
jgi:preprotein translocase subunit YajC